MTFTTNTTNPKQQNLLFTVKVNFIIYKLITIILICIYIYNSFLLFTKMYIKLHKIYQNISIYHYLNCLHKS